MRHNTYLRNFLATALIVLISFALLGGLSTAWNYRQAMSQRRAGMTSTLYEASRYIAAQHIYNELELNNLNFSMFLSMMSGISGYDLLLTDPNGVVCACSDRDFRYLGQIVPETALSSALTDSGSISLSTLGGIYPERKQVAGTPLSFSIKGETYIPGFVFISSDIATFRHEWRQFTGVFVLIAFNVMALAFIISYLTTKKQAEPLNEMAGAARRFAHGDFSSRVETSERTDEIGQLTQAFNAMADSLESSEKLRRDFVANLSHELKSPMTVIAGFAEGILDGTVPPESAPRYLSVISSETRRLSRLVGSMLDASKLQSTDGAELLKASFDIAELVRLAILSLESKIEKRGLDVEAELPETAIMTRGDKDSITQVVYNLVDNAIKFSDPGGVIRLAVWKQEKRAYISVENKGETIPPDDIPHIFDRFHKADKSRGTNREGVGLGLYIVKTILDSHNEDIFVTSSNGETKFVFTLTMA